MPSWLSSLELHGYKTFATRTHFDFSESITAIVGPNGSGKSNITDSIRWVLGEQSYSILRGKKTADMIFSGSEGRARSGMASATITFNNVDGWLPIEFNEVAITRRAYRDGQNEYLINGQRMRLKDVYELLAQSGLAERTYTVIGQGLVDAALALKAEERRKLFEEAAGIGLHRSRREEAIRRLDTTRRNLDRVQDILVELQPRMRSLERQAERALEYERIRTDLEGLLLEWYGYHWNLAQHDLTEAIHVAGEREEELERIRNEQNQYSSRLAVFLEQIQSLRIKLSDFHHQSAELHQEREHLNRDLAVADERLRAIQRQLHATESEIHQAEENLVLDEDRVRIAEENIMQFEEELVQAQAQTDAVHQSLIQREIEREQVNRIIQDLEDQIASFTLNRSEVEVHLLERQMQKTKDQVSISRIEQEIHSASDQASDAVVEFERLSTLQASIEVEIRNLIDTYESQKLIVDEMSTNVAMLRQEIGDTQQAIASIRMQIEILEQAEKNYIDYAEGTRLLLSSSVGDFPDEIQGVLSQQITTEPEYERAIAAALGDYLDAVILHGEPNTALDKLKLNSLHGVLFPLGWVADKSSSIQILEQQDDVKWALECLQISPSLKPLLEMLLGQVWVVGTRTRALELLVTIREIARNNDEQISDELRIVTLDGDVFWLHGPVVSSGQGTDQVPQQLLTRARQQKEFEHQEIEQQNILQTLLQREQLQVAELNDMVEKLEELATKRDQARGRLHNIQLDIDRAKIRLEQAQTGLAWREEQLQNLIGNITNGEQAITEFASQSQNLVQEIVRVQEKLDEARQVLSQLALEEYQAQYTYWQRIRAVTERACSERKSRLEDLISALTQSKQNLQNFIQRRDNLIHEQENVESQIEQLRTRVGNLNQHIADLDSQITPAESELRNIEGEQIKVQSVEIKIRQRVSAAEHNFAQARIHLARKQENLESLRHRIEDDFGLVAFDYIDQVSGPTPLPLEGMVEKLPVVEMLSPEIEEAINRHRAQIRRLGPINPEAQKEYQEIKQRIDFLTEQMADLQKADGDIRQVINELDELMNIEFRRTFDLVSVEFKQIFTRLFGGGAAKLVMTEADDLLSSGIEIEARLPGRRAQGLSLLSGGERSLTAVALVFSLLKVSPTPFCVLDEVDAMLDEANVGRFRVLLDELSQQTQFVIVTHNRNTVQVADIIYGVTMGKDSVSQVISLKPDELMEIVE